MSPLAHMTADERIHYAQLCAIHHDQQGAFTVLAAQIDRI